jgi:DNA-binding transcriptional ArsR family regulator
MRARRRPEPPPPLSSEVIKALANPSRLEIMRWLRDPRAHFPPQVDGDLVDDGVCGLFIAQKLGVGQPTAGEHLRILVRAGVIRATRIKQWTFYKRNEARIREVKRAFRSDW